MLRWVRKWLVNYKEKIWGASPMTIFFTSLLVIVATATRFFEIAKESLWLDEVASIHLANISGVTQIGSYFFSASWFDPHPIFYYFLLNNWMTIFGSSEIALRGFSALFGVAVVVLTFAVGSKLVNTKVGLMAGFFVALNPISVWYSQEARMYTLTSFFFLLSSYLFIKLLQSEGDKKYSASYIVLSALMIYTDYNGFFVLGIHAMLGVFYAGVYKSKEKMKSLLYGFGGIFLLYVPWLQTLYHEFTTGGATWMSSPTFNDGIDAFQKLAGLHGYRGEIYTFLSSELYRPFRVIIILVFGIILLFAAVYILSNWKKRKFGVLLMLLCTIPIVMFFISRHIIPIFNVRQISSFVPMLALLIALGVYRAPDISLRIQEKFNMPNVSRQHVKIVFVVLLAAILAVNTANTLASYTVENKENWRGAADYVENNTTVNVDIILLHASYVEKPFDYYYRGEITTEGINTVDELDKSVQRYDGICLIFSHAKDKKKMVEYMDERANYTGGAKFRGIEIKYYTIRE